MAQPARPNTTLLLTLYSAAIAGVCAAVYMVAMTARVATVEPQLPGDLGAIAIVTGLPIGLTSFVLATLGLTAVFVGIIRLGYLDPDLLTAFEGQPHAGPLGNIWGAVLDTLRLFTGGASARSASARGVAALSLTALLVVVDLVIEGTLGIALWFWSLAPADPIARQAELAGLDSVRAIGASTFLAAALFASATIIGLARAGGERSPHQRATITFCYVLVEVAAFTVLYHAGSLAEWTTFAIAPASHMAPLSLWQSLLLSIGTLTTAGAPGITPLNEPARVAITLELLTLGVLGSWFIGVTEAIRRRSRVWWQD